MGDKKLCKDCDKAIVELSKGDRNALSVIYDAMARMIFSVAYAITSNYQDAEDVLQSTMLEITRYAHRYQRGTNARAWILAIARHRSLDILRKRKGEISIDEGGLSEVPDLCHELSSLEVLDMLSLLEEEEKQLVLFRLYAEMPYAEIAYVMKISVAAAQKRYQRAVKRLKSHYLTLGGVKVEKGY